MSFFDRAQRSIRARAAAFTLALGVLGAAPYMPPVAHANDVTLQVSCSATGDSAVETLTSNAWVYKYLSSDGTASNVLYAAPAGRGFRYYTQCNFYDQPRGRWWVYGHSAVDSRNGWILYCHVHFHC